MLGGILLILVGPAILLLHELGHAVMALWLTDGPVQVLVGRQPGLVRAKVGRLGLHLHVAPARGVGWGGLCVYKPTQLPRDRLLIVAAGPTASLVVAIACSIMLVHSGGRGGGLEGAALVGGIVGSMVEVLYDAGAALVPRLARAWPRSDGAQLRQSLRAQKQLRLLEAEIGRRLTAAEIGQMVASRRLPPAVSRARTSVPPPNAKR